MTDPFEIDLSEIDEEKGVTSGGYNSPAVGRYHMQIVSVDMYGGTNGDMVIDFEVLAGTVKNQEGKVYRDYVAKTAKSVSARMLPIAIAAKIITNAKIIEINKANKPLVIDWESDLPGRQLCLDLEEDEYQGKIRAKCGFGIYAVDDPKAESIPKNKKLFDRFISQIGSTNQPQSKPPEAATPEPAPAASEDPFANVT